MAELCDAIDAIARKSLTTMLRAVERVGQNTIALACGVDDATISKDKSQYWPRFTKSAAAAGLKLVPTTSRCYAPKTIEPLLELARQRMAQLQHVEQLEWSDE